MCKFSDREKEFLTLLKEFSEHKLQPFRFLRRETIFMNYV